MRRTSKHHAMLIKMDSTHLLLNVDFFPARDSTAGDRLDK